MKNTNIYTKVLTFVLSFAIIIGMFGGMKLDARADDTTIDSVKIRVAQPVAGKTLPTVENGGVSLIDPIEKVDVIGVTWFVVGGPSSVTYIEDDLTKYVAKYSTQYGIRVWITPKEGYEFGYSMESIVNDEGESWGNENGVTFIACYLSKTDSEPKPSDDGIKITDGNNSTYKPGSNESLTFRGTGDITTFIEVKVDGNVVDDSNYDKKAGSTIIIFKPEYLATLSNGKHIVELVWNIQGAEKSAIGSFYIGENGGEVVSGNADTMQSESNLVSKHICNFEWTITVDPTTGADGLEEYKCAGCGLVKESHPIPASVAVIKDFYGKIKEAPENGSITYDSGKLYTISDYLLKKMAERNDVTVTVNFEYQNAKYELTFPAGADYSAVLTDEETMYGYFGVAAKLGLKVVAK